MYLDDEVNVLGGKLKVCCKSPKTGFHRDGFCRTGLDDHGEHVVCAVISQEYLDFEKKHGNDLTKPNPDYNFPGLKEGDIWCLSAQRWAEAYEEDIAPQVILEATHKVLLNYIELEELKQFEYEA